MDIASKLKFASWSLIVCLWGLFMLQYSNADKYRNALGIGTRSTYGDVKKSKKKKTDLNPFLAISELEKKMFDSDKSKKNTSVQEVPPAVQEPPQTASASLAMPKAVIKGKNPNVVSFSTSSAYDYNIPVSTAFRASDMGSINVSGNVQTADSSMSGFTMPDEFKRSSSKRKKTYSESQLMPEARQTGAKTSLKDISPGDYPATPSGFRRKITKHFVLYEEGEVSAELENKAEEMHGSIMLDLAEFKPWEREKTVFIYYAHSQASYQKISGRPAWSGGSASLDMRSIFLYKDSKDRNGKITFGIMAHEMTHMYFDSFFPPKYPSPLWLSEGMAVYVQSEKARYTPLWLTENMKRVQNGGGFKFDTLVAIDDLEGADEDNIRLWYAQSYLLTKFLMKAKGKTAFYNFCKYMKSGFPLSQSVKIAYGQDLKTLESNWRLNMQMEAASR